MRKLKAKRVTLADVASKAGVSVATASVAITGRPSGNCRVSPAVAEKIRRAARALNYRPNLQARNLSTQRTHTVAVLVKQAAWHNAIFYVTAAQRLLRQRGYVETFMLYPDNRLESERDSLELCIDRRVDGIIAMPLIDLEGKANVELFDRILRDEGIPIVHLGLSLPGCAVPSVQTDEVEGIRSAVHLLHSMGHERIAMATVKGHDNPDPFNPFCIAHQRYEGYLRGMSELKLTPAVYGTDEICTDTTMLFDKSVELASKIASASTRPTAVIAFSDFFAAGLIAGLNDHRLRVPDDMSVLSIGGQPFGRMTRPMLSTLSPAFEKKADIATNMLLRMIEGGEGQSAMVPPALTMRQSVRAIKDH